MKVLEIIQRSTEFLQAKGVDNPRLQVEWMLSQVLGLPRLQLYLNFEKELEESQVARLRDWIRRRGAREPLQHILGSVSFCGFEIAVNSSVLVPRPETEQLAEMGWEFLNCLRKPGRFLDLGSGSGCLAIALAAKAPEAAGIAVEQSEAALQLAQSNAQALGLADRITFRRGSWFDAVPSPDEVFDLIISNPPYIPTDEIESLQPEVRLFDPRAALDGGPDGLAPYREFAAKGGPRLAAGGKMLLEFGDGQHESLSKIFESQNWIVEPLLKDYSGRPRFLVLARKAE